MNSYLNNEKEYNAYSFNEVQSYLNVKEEMDEYLPYSYSSNEYDMFSEVDKSLINNVDAEQLKIMSDCFRCLQSELVEIMLYDQKHSIQRIMPKASMNRDDDGAISFNWAFSTFRATLMFGGKEDNYDAFCTIAVQNDEDSISICTENINDANIVRAMSLLLSSIIAYS